MGENLYDENFSKISILLIILNIFNTILGIDLNAVYATTTYNPSILNIESPVNSEILRGVVTIQGYILSNYDPSTFGFMNCSVYIDGNAGDTLFNLKTSINREDLKNKYPNYKYAGTGGFSYNLDTVKLKNGNHNIKFNFNGIIKEVNIIINNYSQRLVIDNIDSTKAQQGFMKLTGYIVTSYNNISLYDYNIYIDDVRVDSYILDFYYNLSRQDIKEIYPYYSNYDVAGYKYILDTRTLKDGEHNIKIKFKDTESSINFMVDNSSYNNLLDDSADVTFEEKIKRTDRAFDEMIEAINIINSAIAEINDVLVTSIDIINNIIKVIERTNYVISKINILKNSYTGTNVDWSELDLKIDLYNKLSNDSKQDMASKAMDYLSVSLQHIIYGKYTYSINTLGVVGDLAIGFFDIDLPADIRDLSHDLKYWEWSWGHAGETTLDAIGLIPIIGIIKYGDEVAVIVKDSEKGLETLKIKGGIKGGSEAKNYKYSKSVIEKANDLYHDFPQNLDNFVLENPNVYRPDGRIEFLAKGSVNGVEGVYHITTKADMIIHRTFIPASDWERFSNVNGLPSLADIPALK